MGLSDRLTSAFISAKDATTEDLAFRINGGADFLCICTRTHSIHMHLVLARHGLEEVFPTRSGARSTRRDTDRLEDLPRFDVVHTAIAFDSLLLPLTFGPTE